MGVRFVDPVLGGIPAAWVAGIIVREMQVETLRWQVVLVALCAAALMLRAAMRSSEPEIASA